MRYIYPIAATGLLGLIGLAGWFFSSASQLSDAGSSTDVPIESTSDAASESLISLTEIAINSANLEYAIASIEELRTSRIIPGRLDYDQTKHVMIRSACEGVVKELMVLPGQKVMAGEVVSIISSPEVGAVRSEINQRQAELDMAEKRKIWKGQVRDGVKRLVSQIRASATPEQIGRILKDSFLGEYREHLVTAYSRQRLAETLEDNIKSAAASGAVSGRVQAERRSEMQTAQASLSATIEQSLFEVEQSFLEAEAAAQKAAQDLSVSIEKLKLLLGPAASSEDQNVVGPISDERLSTVKLVSPITGTVQGQLVSTFERVDPGQSVLLVADTSHLWAVAEVRESDWKVTGADVGQRITITSPLLADETFVGNVLIIGPNVDPKSGAMPLVAKLQTSDPSLKPGMFIRMRVETGQPRSVLAVPDSAVVVHEGDAFVFVPDGTNLFRRVDVTVGETEDGMTEIISGINEGRQVVSSGVFKLQSHLLLAGEEE